jgi:hypothetical protein
LPAEHEENDRESRLGGERKLNLDPRRGGHLRPKRIGSSVLLKAHSKKKNEKDHEEKEQITEGQQPDLVSFFGPGQLILVTEWLAQIPF